MTQWIFRQTAHNGNIFKYSAIQNVQSSNWNCRQSTPSINMKPTPVTWPQLEVFWEVPITYHVSISETPNQKNITNYNNSLMSSKVDFMWLMPQLYQFVYSLHHVILGHYWCLATILAVSFGLFQHDFYCRPQERQLRTDHCCSLWVFHIFSLFFSFSNQFAREQTKTSKRKLCMH